MPSDKFSQAWIELQILQMIFDHFLERNGIASNGITMNHVKCLKHSNRYNQKSEDQKHSTNHQLLLKKSKSFQRMQAKQLRPT